MPSSSILVHSWAPNLVTNICGSNHKLAVADLRILEENKAIVEGIANVKTVEFD